MEETIDERFYRFHLRNPQVYKELLRLARQAKRRGLKRIGIRMIWEVMRWNLSLSTDSDEEFRLNDHFTSRYVRLIILRNPSLRDMFELREIRTQ